VNVSVIANTGQVTIAEHNNSGGAGLQHATLSESVSYAEIATFSSDASLERPILSDAGGNTSQPVLNHGNVTLRAAVWSLQYANSTSIPRARTAAKPRADGPRIPPRRLSPFSLC
jgi:hypothetical protein